MNRTIEQWQAINPEDVAYNATTGAVQHLVQSAISDLQELARQRDELFAELRAVTDALEYVDINAPTLVGYGIRAKRIADAKATLESIKEQTK